MKSLLGGAMTGCAIVALVILSDTATDRRTHATNPPSYNTGGGVIVPSHGAVPGPALLVPYNSSTVNGLTPGERRIIELLESIDKKLPATPVAQALPGGIDPLKVAQKSCIRCHIPSAADEKGGGYILFADDKATAFKPVNRSRRTEENRLVRDEVITRGTMPKGGKLTPAERSAFEHPIFK